MSESEGRRPPAQPEGRLPEDLRAPALRCYRWGRARRASFDPTVPEHEERGPHDKLTTDEIMALMRGKYRTYFLALTIIAP